MSGIQHFFYRRWGMATTIVSTNANIYHNDNIHHDFNNFNYHQYNDNHEHNHDLHNRKQLYQRNLPKLYHDAS